MKVIANPVHDSQLQMYPSSTEFDSTYLKIDGTNHMTAPLGINTAPRVGSVLDIISSDTGSVPSVTSGSLSFNYTGGNYYNEGYSFSYDIYAYRDFGMTRVYSNTAYTVSGTDNNASTGYYTVGLSWGEVMEADGYRIIVSDNWYGASGDYYFDVEGTVATVDGGTIIETGLTYSSGNTVTPKTTTAGADLYVSKIGDVYSTGHFYFGNLPTLALSGNNGLTLVGGSNKVLSLPTTANVNLGGISLKAGRVPTGNHIVFPQGYGGSTSPGIRFEGGATEAGLSVDDGIAEFWDNFSRYCTPVAGHISGVFRLDTRLGYETESFMLGGADGSGNGRVIITANFATGDVNLSPWGLGSVAIGDESPSSPVTGLNGYLSVHNSIFVGKDIIVQDATNGMKIATATSQKIGFYGTTPIAQPSAYTVTNPSSDKSFDVSNTSVNELAAVLGTLIGDLKLLGLIG